MWPTCYAAPVEMSREGGGGGGEGGGEERVFSRERRDHEGERREGHSNSNLLLRCSCHID